MKITSYRKNKIYVTSIGFRFYEKDGWNRDSLKIILKTGGFLRLFDEENGIYYSLRTGSEVIVDLLMDNPIYGHERWKKLAKRSAYSILSERNW